ncbi:MAG: FtsW/RodA/SpoVE family cell cycle protein, partial [Planctomycetota bacterium]|nr:FtsW/RodA/SpoVE family cell cycle protein [Planctomycetota bacterium]
MAEEISLNAVAARAAEAEDVQCERRAAGARLLAIAFTLTCVGLVFVYSASAVRAAAGGWEMTLLRDQALWAALALTGFCLFSRLPVAGLARLWLPLCLLTLALLALVLI